MGKKKKEYLILPEKLLVGRNRKTCAFSFVYGYCHQYQNFSERFLVNIWYIIGFTKSIFKKLPGHKTSLVIKTLNSLLTDFW